MAISQVRHARAREADGSVSGLFYKSPCSRSPAAWSRRGFWGVLLSVLLSEPARCGLHIFFAEPVGSAVIW